MQADDLIRRVDILSRLEPHEVEALRAKLRRRSFSRGEVVFQQGDPGDRLYFVADGLVKIAIISGEGRENDIALIAPGDCFGEMSMFDSGSRSATAIAMEATQVLTLSREDFLDFMHHHSQVAIRIIALLARRLRATDQMVGDMVFLDVPTRVGKKLLELARLYTEGATPSASVTVQLGQEELSGLVGCTREAVTRALGAYRRMGLVATAHRKITIRDPKSLERVVFQGTGILP